MDRAAGRNLVLSLGERFADIKFLLRDRCSNFTSSFDAVFQATGTTILRSAVRVPRMNAICERLVGTLRQGRSGRWCRLLAGHANGHRPLLQLRGLIEYKDRVKVAEVGPG